MLFINPLHAFHIMFAIYDINSHLFAAAGLCSYQIRQSFIKDMSYYLQGASYVFSELVAYALEQK